MTYPVHETVDILGVMVSVLTQEELLSTVVEWAQQPLRRSIFYANAHSMNLAASLADFRTCLNQADILYVDGISVAWAGRFLHRARLSKMTGRVWLPTLITQIQERRLKLFFLGGKPGVAAAAAAYFNQECPNVQIVGAHHGFIEDKDSSIIETINQSGAQILLIGMGSPKQELWLNQNRVKIQAPVCWTVGALMDYFAGVERPVPYWMDQRGLEWLWRFLMDPLGKWQRYLIGNPLFVARVMLQKWLLLRSGK